MAWILAALVAIISQTPTVTLKGQVTDASTGEPLAKALVSVRAQSLDAQTDEQGRFEISGVVPGTVELYVSTVGYGLLRRTVDVPSGVGLELDIRLGQEALRRSDEVSVTASVFEPIETHTASERTLNQTELKNLSGVVVDDPLRSVQSLPGVATGDDFNAQFAVRGAGFRSLGFYIDGVLTTSPFHGVRDINDGGSLSILNGDLVESVSLISGGAPAPFGDRTAANLNIQTREGSRERFVNRFNAAASGISHTAEGPIGASRRASWLVSARKSYLDWLVKKLSENPDESAAFGYSDIQGRFSFDPGSRHHFSFTSLFGDSGLSRDRERARLGINSLYLGDSKTLIANAGWRWVVSPSTLMQSRVYVNRGTAENLNRSGELLYESKETHSAYRGDFSHQFADGFSIEAGTFVRRIQQSELRRRFDITLNAFRSLESFSAATWQPGGYVQTALRLGSRANVTLGGRSDHFSATEQTVWLPRLSASLGLTRRTTLVASFGQFAQFPELPRIHGVNGTPRLRAERSTHAVAGIEQLLTDKIRVRAEVYNQDEGDRIFAEQTEFRIERNVVRVPARGPVLRNSLRGYSRGIELFLQRRSANGLSGWASYAYARARFRDGVSGHRFDGDFDQRHTLNLYGSYRLTPTVNVSAKYRYGSNFPLAGFVVQSGQRFFMADQRNLVRLPAYSRLDLRANKAFHYQRWKLTLYAEVTNALNRENYRYTVDGENVFTRQVFVARDKLLPFLPIAGLTIEF